MGGDCLNTGCVPSKALIRSAKLLAAHAAFAASSAFASATAEFDFAEVMERVQRVVRQVEPHDSVERYTRLGVECLQGSAKITSPWTVEVALADGGTRTLTTKSIVIAAGARPFVPPIPGLAEAQSAHLRHRVGAAHAAAAPRGAGRRPDRLRARAVLRAPRLEGDAGRDAAAASWCARIPEFSALVDGALPRRGHRRAHGPQGEGSARRRRREGARGRARRAPRCASPSTRSCAPSGASPTPRATASRSSASRSRSSARSRSNEYLADALSQHLRLRRRRRPVPVHAHRLAHGVVLRGERALRQLPQVPRRLFGRSLGHVHRPGGRARGTERDRGEGEGRSPTR